MKYKLYMVLEREGSELIIKDEVENSETKKFVLEEYIYEHDLEAYTIIDFRMEKIK